MSPWLLAAAAAAVATGACVQAAFGFGFALVCAPVLALISPSLVPGPVLVASCVLSLLTARREHESIDRQGVLRLLLGRLPGALVGATLLSSLPRAAVSVTFGVLVLLAVALSALGLRVARSPRTLVAVGALSGLMGTLTAIGGPPVALIYQHARGPMLRATLNAYFTLGALLSIGALALVGRFGLDELGVGAFMLPPVAFGFALSSRLRRVLDRGLARPAVLVIAAISALSVITRALG